MKKLMIAGVAGLCAAVTFGLESANVVGYNTLNTGDTFQMLGSSFAGVGTNVDGFTLESLQGNFADEDAIQVSYMDDDGIVQFTTYQYLTVDGFGMDADGWYDGNYELANETMIPRGSAVWFISSEPKSIQTSGEVATGDTIHAAFTEQYSMICSAYPVAFNPNASSVTWSGLVDEDEIQVAYVDSDGIVQFNVYQYLTVDGFGMDADGWYDGNYELVSEPIAEVGQGFWLILSDFANVTLTEKSPITK